MEPLALTAEALREPWRLWTGHLVHYGWAHALANAAALLVPVVLIPPQARRRLLAVALLAAPLLSLLILADLGQGQYRGASGLACALWAWAGLWLLVSEGRPTLGCWMLGGLLLKLAAETVPGGGLLLRPEGWQILPAAHLWGALIGLLATLPTRLRPHPA